jgi:hypothetical protein
MKWIAVPLLLYVLGSTAAAAECPAPGSVVELFGTIGKDLGISMNLTFQKDRLSGSYAYDKYGKKIPLTGTCTGASLTLQESDTSGKPTGSFRGTFTKPQIVEGTWSTLDGKKSLPFHLQALLPTDHVSGEYRTGNYLDNKTSTGAELNILLLGDGQLRIQGDALWVNPAKNGSVHTGDVSSTAKLQGDKAYYIESSDDPDSCRFTIRFTNRTITVTDDNMKCGGMNVTFDGTYERVGPPTFQEALQPPP